jgi:phage replication O-like protein O
MSGFKSPNYTQVPNDLFDVLLCDLGNAELKVILCIIRKTIGFHKEDEKVKFGINKLMKMTGLSKNGVKNGAAQAERRGLIERTDQEGEAEWVLITINTPEHGGGQPVTPPIIGDSKEGSASDPGGGQPVTPGGSASDPFVGHLKKDLKKPLNKKEVVGENSEKIEDGAAFSFFMENFGAPTPFDLELMGELCDEHTPHWVIEAMKLSVKANARRLAHTEAILKRWKTEGYGKDRSNGKKAPVDSTEDVIQKAMEMEL